MTRNKMPLPAPSHHILMHFASEFRQSRVIFISYHNRISRSPAFVNVANVQQNVHAQALKHNQVGVYNPWTSSKPSFVLTSSSCSVKSSSLEPIISSINDSRDGSPKFCSRSFPVRNDPGRTIGAQEPILPAREFRPLCSVAGGGNLGIDHCALPTMSPASSLSKR